MTEPQKIVSLFGGPLEIGEPDAEVVLILGDALERAKRGEIIGCAVALALTNNTTDFNYRTGPSASGEWCKYQLHHAIVMLGHHYTTRCLEEAQDLPPPSTPEPA